MVFRVLGEIAMRPGLRDGLDDAWTLDRLQVLDLIEHGLVAKCGHWNLVEHRIGPSLHSRPAEFCRTYRFPLSAEPRKLPAFRPAAAGFPNNRGRRSERPPDV